MDTQQQEVWQVIRAFNQAFAANDVDAYFAFIDENITVITPSSPYRIEGLAADREGFEHSLRLGSGRVGFFQEMQPRVDVFGETAVVTYYSRGSFGPQGAEKMAYLKETDVLIKRNGTWKFFHIHVSTAV